MKKRILAALLAALMVFTALSALTALSAFTVSADDDDDDDDEFVTYSYCGWKYVMNEDKKTITILKDKNIKNGYLSIPTRVNGFLVTGIDGHLLGRKKLSLAKSGDEITVAKMNDSVKYIGPHSFSGFKNMRTVKISKNVTVIDFSAFSKCISLKEITLPECLTYIGSNAFACCETLKSINIAASVTEIGESAFDDCDSLQTVYYGGTREQWNAISIGEENEALTSATIYYNHPAEHSVEFIPSAATCVESGAEAHYHCTLCGKDFLDEDGEDEYAVRTDPALGHVGGEWTLTTPPTCTEAGVETQLCARCGALTANTRPVAALGHDYQPVSTTAPTCTEPGFTTFVCSRCGATYNSDGQSAPGHYFGDWTVTSAPSCTESGEETRYCARCGASETRTVEPLGHSFGVWTETTAPSCTVSGEETAICTVCGAVGTEVIEPNGHSFTPWQVLTWENCTTDGKETRYCRVCGYVEMKVVPATGHSFVGGYCEYCCENDPSAPKITVSDAWSKTRGDRIELTVSLEDNPGVSSLILGLSYDDSSLTLESAENGDLFGEIVDFNSFDGGTGTASFDSVRNVTGDGVLMTLTFTVNDEAMTDWYDVGAFVRFANDENGDDIDFLWYEGIVDVIVYGDADESGGTDVMDVILISQNILDNTVYVSPGADANGDGAVDIFDVILISQYILDPTVVLGP